ncbi:MAG TPA: DNA-formamidopyrimidine glycosylase family protein, partial [Actinomycetes bacterium]|nr:DNA-formamidopyrimidine glycosylase family protein [Actinomycetes bacterium]
LPEVETLRHDLDKEVGGRKVKAVELRAARVVRRHRNRKEFTDRLVGRKLGTTARLGALLVLGLDGGPETAALVVDLAATGRLLKQRSAAPVDRQTDAVLSFSVGGDLRVMDLGEAGELFLAGQDELEELADRWRGAIDPLADAMAWQALGASLGARQERLRALLTDPSFVAGIGPVYADEILWSGGLRWDRDSDSLSAQEVRRLHRAIQEVVQEAVRLRGVSVGETPWLDLHGGKGEFEPQLSVYQREGQPCRRCRTPLVHEVIQAGQTTYYCPKCQS